MKECPIQTEEKQGKERTKLQRLRAKKKARKEEQKNEKNSHDDIIKQNDRNLQRIN